MTVAVAVAVAVTVFGGENLKAMYYNSGQTSIMGGWLQGALKAMDVRYGQRGNVVGKVVGECWEVIL